MQAVATVADTEKLTAYGRCEAVTYCLDFRRQHRQNRSMSDDGANKELSSRELDVRPGQPHRWKPGQSGNPSGRPKDQFSFMGILRSALAEENRSGKSVGERIIARYIKLALAGNGQALEALVARIDGKPAQSLTLRGESDAPLHVRHSARLEAPDSPPHPPALVNVGGAEASAPDSGYVGTEPQLPAPEQEQEAAGDMTGPYTTDGASTGPGPDTTE